MRVKALMSRLRRQSRFSLRTCLLATTVLAVWLGLHMRSVRQQQAAIEAIDRYGGWVYYDYQMVDDFQLDPGAESLVPKWAAEHLGLDHFHHVSQVQIVPEKVNGVRVEGDAHADEVLSQLKAFPKLKTLWINESQVTDDGLRHVSELTNLRGLGIWGARDITAKGVAHLRKLAELDRLHLDDCGVSDNSLRSLSQLPNLRILWIQKNCVTDHGLKHVREMTQLHTLVVGRGDNRISDAGLVYLKQLTHLERLGLQGTQVTNAGLHRLEHLESLKSISLTGSDVEDASWLKRRLPSCVIQL